LKILSKTANLRLALFMALALLVAQLGAQAHAYSHIRADSHATDLLAAAGGAGLLPFLAPQGVLAAPGAAIPTLSARTPTPAFRSRAPPSHQ
jgi:hypothetical protein